MKVTLSPLVAALRGRAGGAVAAVTRGVQYVKSHGRPSGPPTEAQLEHRAHMERMGRWWRSLPVQVRDFITLLATAEGITGFAMFTRTMASMHSVTYDCTIVGDNPYFDSVYDLQCDPPAFTDSIQVKWEIDKRNDGAYVHFFEMVFVRPPHPESIHDVIHYRPDCTAYATARYASIDKLVSGTEYWIVGCLASKINIADNTVFGGGWADVGKTKS